jgi:SAM-dependent methyltransferase
MPGNIEKFHAFSAEHGLAAALVQTGRWILFKLGITGADARRTTAVAWVVPGDGRRTQQAPDYFATSVPLPPLSLMQSVGAHSVKMFIETGEATHRLLQAELGAASTILDIGSGCGRVARWFVDDPRVVAYAGFDVIAESVEWCRNFLVPLAPGKFRFHHFDVRSAEYNPAGKLAPGDLRFPLGDAEADIVFAASVFTHLLEADARHYLGEINRVLKPGSGRAFVSILPSPQDGTYSGDEAHVEVGEGYFMRMAAEHGLELATRYGDVLGQHWIALKTLRH